MTDGPTLTQHHHPGSTGDTKVYAWCCALCALGQIFNKTHPFGDSPRESSLPLPCPWQLFLHMPASSSGCHSEFTKEHVIGLSLSCFFNLLFEVLKVAFHLQLFKNIGYRPSVVQFISLPCFTPGSVYPPTSVLPIPQKTLVCFLCLGLLLFIILNSLLYCFVLLIYNYICVYTCIYICGKITQVLTDIWHSSI